MTSDDRWSRGGLLRKLAALSKETRELIVLLAQRGGAAGHICNANGMPERVIDESTVPPRTRIAATCSVCGQRQIPPGDQWM